MERWITLEGLERWLALETLFAVALAGVGAAIAVVSWGYGFGTLSRPGPGLYPFFVGIAVVLLALLEVLGDLRKPAHDAVRLDRGAVRRLLFMAAIFCFWIAAMPLLGYVVVTLLATYAFAKTLALEGQAQPLALAGGTALFIYILFDHWLYIDLPRGLFG